VHNSKVTYVSHNTLASRRYIGYILYELQGKLFIKAITRGYVNTREWCPVLRCITLINDHRLQLRTNTIQLNTAWL